MRVSVIVLLGVSAIGDAEVPGEESDARSLWSAPAWSKWSKPTGRPVNAWSGWNWNWDGNKWNWSWGGGWGPNPTEKPTVNAWDSSWSGKDPSDWVLNGWGGDAWTNHAWTGDGWGPKKPTTEPILSPSSGPSDTPSDEPSFKSSSEPSDGPSNTPSSPQPTLFVCQEDTFCQGVRACEGVPDLNLINQNGACNGFEACRNVGNTISFCSCIGSQSCLNNVGNIGNDSW